MIRTRYYIALLLFLVCSVTLAQNTRIIGIDNGDPPPYKVSGSVASSSTGEALIGATIYMERQQQGTTTDFDGMYELSLYKGLYTLKISMIGYETITRSINVVGEGRLNILLDEALTELGEVVVSAEKENSNVRSTDIGKNILNLESIKTLPPLAGEVDVLKSLVLLPGVSTQGEASSGFNVRGGGSDQNLILLGGATLYNPSHLFGFFSSFNSSVVRDVQLYKGAVPANFGGRGSSVVDISYRKGNFREWEGDLTLGMVSSKFSAGGPIVPGRVSVLTAGRISYTNWLLGTTRDANVKNSAANFYDGNVILSYAVNSKNELEYSFYNSYDRFNFASDTANIWQNTSHVLKWTSAISDRFTINLQGTYNDYSSIIEGQSAIDPFELRNGIIDQDVKLGAEYALSENHTFQVGVQSKQMAINLGELTPGSGSSINPEKIDEEKAIESAAYAQYDADLSDAFGFSLGFRFNDYAFLGSGTVNEYGEFERRRPENVVGVTTYGENEVIQRFNGYEPRAALKYQFNPTTSVKLGYNRMYQYIHLISNTSAISPNNVWKLSDPFLDPEIVTQYSVGIFKNFRNNIFETSIEAYYKDWQNVVEYIDGADLFLNENLETELLTGIGRSYGLEFYVNKQRGRLNGWFSYTYSRSLRQVEGPFIQETINRGKWYPSNFDRPHDFTTVGKYRLGAMTVLSAIFTYSSGRPVTYPYAKIEYSGRQLAYFTERNARRAPDYHRLDLSLEIKSRATKKIWSGTWVFSIYNVYGRNNAFSVFFRDADNAPPQPYQLTIVGSPLPALSYEIKF